MEKVRSADGTEIVVDRSGEGPPLVLVVGAFLLFLSDVPLALKASAPTPMGVTIKKSIIRTSVMALGFGTGYLVAVVVSFRYLFRRMQDA